MPARRRSKPSGHTGFASYRGAVIATRQNGIFTVISAWTWIQKIT
jgi:hypothetical protein